MWMGGGLVPVLRSVTEIPSASLLAGLVWREGHKTPSSTPPFPCPYRRGKRSQPFPCSVVKHHDDVILKTLYAVILSEAKNLTCLVVSSMYMRFFASLRMTGTLVSEA